MKIESRARAKKISLETQRVFLYCAPSNAADRDTLIDDLISHDAGMDCAVLYVDPPDAPRDEDLLKKVLRETKALVLWVTPELRTAILAGDIPVEYRLAREVGTPVLPIATFPELFTEDFNQRMGQMHGIARSDDKDGGYRVKLRAQLEKFLATEEQMKAIREKAFTAEVFVSYRKVDIEEARRFMKAFHDIPGFEVVSIWYDSFLTAGRDFNKEIKEAITTSDAFALVVTPNLLKPNDEGKPNYVQTTEYPFAKEAGKPVVSVETLDTDSATFTELFPDTDKTVSLKDPTVLRDAFHAKLGDAVTPKPLDSERAYYLGMAYLKGYGVERDFDRAIMLLEMATGEFSESALNAANQLAKIYQNGTGTSIDYDKALLWYKKTAVISGYVFGTEHPDTIGFHNNIGMLYCELGDYLHALEWLQKVLTIREEVLGKEHPDTAASYGNIGIVHNALGNYPKALEWLQKALAVFEVQGKEHPYVAATYNNIGVICKKQGDYPMALEWHRKALAIRKRVLGINHPDTAASYNNIGIIYKEQGYYARALKWQKKAMEIKENVLGKEHPDTATSYDNIGIIYKKQCTYKEALDWHLKALLIKEKVLGKMNPDTAKTYGNIGNVYCEQGDYPHALDWLLKALAVDENVLGKEHPDTATSYNNIGNVYHSLIDYEQALEWYQKALASRKKILGKEHPDTAKIYGNIGIVYYAKRDYQQALEYFFTAFRSFFHSVGMEHPHTIGVGKNMMQAFVANGGRKRDFEQWLIERMEKADRGEV